jgi:hypothetical protein
MRYRVIRIRDRLSNPSIWQPESEPLGCMNNADF